MIKNKDKQPLTKTSEVHVGDVVWTIKTEWNPTEQWHEEEFIGPFHVIDIRAKNISTATMYVLFDSFDKTEIQVRLHDIYVPIIEKIDNPVFS
tara:strand:- start:1856 stop:2134 length:279 start_codon:yes stop_codon:yes gene_type:complete